MKRVILSAFLILGTTAVVSAQTTHHKHTSKAVATRKAPAKKKETTAAKVNTVKLNNRKIYHWTNGQKSTPSGQDATSSNGSGYAVLKKDTAKVVKKKQY